MPAQQPERYEDIVAEDIADQVLGRFAGSSARGLIVQAARLGFRKGIGEAVEEVSAQIDLHGHLPLLDALAVEMAQFPTRGPWAHVQAGEMRKKVEAGVEALIVQVDDRQRANQK